MKKFIKLFSLNKTEKILAIIVTVVIWVIVVSKSEETRTLIVKVETNLGGKRVLISDPLTSVHVQATGNKFDFARLTDDDLSILVDLSFKDSSKTMIYFDGSKFSFSDYLKINQIFPKEIIYSTAPKMVKTVSIEPYLDGQPDKGWKVSGVEFSPEKVTISGPEDIVDDIESVVTERINLAKLKTGISQKVGLLLRSPYLKIESEKEKILVKVKVERDIREMTFKHIPIALEDGTPADIKPSFVSVRLKGPVEKMDELVESGFSVYVKNMMRRKYSVNKYFLKGLPSGVQPVKFQKVNKIIVKMRKK